MKLIWLQNKLCKVMLCLSGTFWKFSALISWFSKEYNYPNKLAVVLWVVSTPPAHQAVPRPQEANKMAAVLFSHALSQWLSSTQTGQEPNLDPPHPVCSGDTSPLIPHRPPALPLTSWPSVLLMCHQGLLCLALCGCIAVLPPLQWGLGSRAGESDRGLKTVLLCFIRQWYTDCLVQPPSSDLGSVTDSLCVCVCPSLSYRNCLWSSPSADTSWSRWSPSLGE